MSRDLRIYTTSNSTDVLIVVAPKSDESSDYFIYYPKENKIERLSNILAFITNKNREFKEVRLDCMAFNMLTQLIYPSPTHSLLKQKTITSSFISQKK